MSTSRRAALAGSVFLVALATGFAMQNGNALASRFAFEAKPEVPVERLAASVTTDLPESVPRARPILPAEPEVVALATPDVTRFVNRAPEHDAGAISAELAETEAFSPYGLRCDLALTATPGPAATVQLVLNAPCHGGEVVSVRHGALRFTDVIAADGSIEALVPALSSEAHFEMTFRDGATVEAQAEVPEAAGFERVALQWQGTTGLQLHAFEFGADYGEPGHVHAAAAHTPDRAELRGAGYLTRLGRDTVPGAWVSEVYSFPAADARDQGVVRISIEAEITPVTCGRDVSAEALQSASGTARDTVELSLKIPGCDAVGEFLVLGNVVPDMDVAAR